MAAKAGDYDEVERRLVAGEDVNSRGTWIHKRDGRRRRRADSRTPLLCLLGTADRDGCTVMYYAAEQGNVQAMARLIERHADVNLANEAGWTPLHAVVCGTQPDHEVCLGMLLHEGANLRAATKNGETPLQLAQRRNAQPGIMQLLQRATLSASVKLLRQLADYPGSTLDADKATALHMVLRQYDEMQGTGREAAPTARLQIGLSSAAGAVRSHVFDAFRSRPGKEPPRHRAAGGGRCAGPGGPRERAGEGGERGGEPRQPGGRRSSRAVRSRRCRGLAAQRERDAVASQRRGPAVAWRPPRRRRYRGRADGGWRAEPSC